MGARKRAGRKAKKRHIDGSRWTVAVVVLARVEVVINLWFNFWPPIFQAIKFLT